MGSPFANIEIENALHRQSNLKTYQNLEEKMSPTSIYRIKIVRGDFEFEAQGDKKFVLEMLQRFENAPSKQPIMQIAESPARINYGAESKDTGKTLSASEFIRMSGYKKHTDIALAFGYYLEKVQGIASFTPADINNCYYDAKLESSNTRQMVALNIKRGYLMEAKQDKSENKRRYTLTQSGIQYIETQLNQTSKANS